MIAVVPNLNVDGGAEIIYVNSITNLNNNTGKKFAQRISKEISPNAKVKDLSFFSQYNSTCGVATAINATAVVQLYNEGQEFTEDNLKKYNPSPNPLNISAAEKFYVNERKELNKFLDDYKDSENKQKFIQNYIPELNLDKVDELIHDLVKAQAKNEEVSIKQVEKFYKDVYNTAELKLDITSNDSQGENIFYKQVFATTQLLNTQIPKITTSEKIFFKIGKLLGDNSVGRFFKGKVLEKNAKRLEEITKSRENIIESLRSDKLSQPDTKKDSPKAKKTKEALTNLHEQLSKRKGHSKHR